MRYVNNIKLIDSRIHSLDYDNNYMMHLENGYRKILDKDEYFVFSNVISRSLDSRYFGIINKNNIIGKAYLLYEVK